MRDCLSSNPYSLILKYPLEEANFAKALKTIEDVYSRTDEVRKNLVNKIFFTSWKDLALNKLVETITEWKIDVETLNAKYQIDLFCEGTKVKTSYILLEKLNEIVKTKLIETLNVDYPSVDQIMKTIPIIVMLRLGG